MLNGYKLKNELDSLPQLPFSIYFLNSDSQVMPKKLFTVTRKRISRNQGLVELYVSEFKRYIILDTRFMLQAKYFILN